MSEGVIITGKDLKVVSYDHRASLLSVKGDISKKDALFDHFPQLAGLVSPMSLITEKVIRAISCKGREIDVHVVPAGDLLCFRFLSPDRPGKQSEPGEMEFLADQNRMLMSIIEDAPIGIMLIDEGGSITYMNKKQEENSRKKREDVLYRPIWEVYPKSYDHAEVMDMFLSLYGGKESRASVCVDHYYPQFYRKDMIVKFFGCRIEDVHCVVLFVEIEDELYQEKRKSEKTGEKLRQSETFLAHLLDASPNMVISVDSRNRIVSFNKTAERLLGFSPSQVYNTPVTRLFPPEEQAGLKEAIASPSPWFGTMHIYRFDKTTFLTELYAAKIRDTESGKDIATLLLMVDIEEREKLRTDLIQSQKMSFIGELVSALAHQLNNPLVGVMNISEVLLRRMEPSDKNYHLLKMIHEAGITCHETISRLLSFSRKTERDTWVTLDLQEILTAAIELVSRHALFQAVELQTSFHSVPLVRGDPVLLQQSFMNILFNSAQAVGPKGRIAVSCTGVYGMGNQVEVTIVDNGQGIPRKDLPRIFEPFFTTKDTDKGTGIGLSLVYWIIQDHKGRIEVESEVGEGTSFKVILPAIVS
jgi:two-component system, NtrC family, sensor kinase